MKYLKYIIESVKREFVTAHRCYYLYSIVLLYITYSYYLYIKMCAAHEASTERRCHNVFVHCDTKEQPCLMILYIKRCR